MVGVTRNRMIKDLSGKANKKLYVLASFLKINRLLTYEELINIRVPIDGSLFGYEEDDDISLINWLMFLAGDG